MKYSEPGMQFPRVRWVCASSLLPVAFWMIRAAGCQQRGDLGNSPTGSSPPRVVRVAQSGSADVAGNYDVALQEAAGLLRPGNTLEIAPGTCESPECGIMKIPDFTRCWQTAHGNPRLGTSAFA